MSIIREPRDIPNQQGFRFVGITKDAQFIWLTVQKKAQTNAVRSAGTCTQGWKAG